MLLENLTVSENGSIVKSSDDVYFGQYSFKHYKKLVQGEHTYVIGYDDAAQPQNRDGNKPTGSTFGKREILDSLIALWENIGVKNDGDFELTIKTIIKWCQKYGMPYLWAGGWTGEGQFSGGEGNEYGNLKVTGYYCFDVDTFIYDLGNLYISFLYIYKLKDGVSSKVMNDTLASLNDTSEEEMRTKLALKLMVRSSSYLSYHDGKPKLATYFSNPYQLAKYQLMLLYVTPNGTEVKQCQHCNSLFITDTGKRKYCMNCNSGMFWARENRKKERKNGEHNKESK